LKIMCILKKMNDLVQQIAREVEYKGAAYIRIPADLGLFTELVIFGYVLDMPSVDVPRIDKDVNIEMKLVLLKIKLSYQDKYKLHYYVQDMVRCYEYCG